MRRADVQIAIAASTLEGGLSAETQALMAKKIAPTTFKNYTLAIKDFRLWLGKRKATDETIANYLSQRHNAKDGLAPGSLALFVAAIKFWAKENGADGLVGPATINTLKGIRRAGRGRGRGQVRGLSREQVAVMVNAAVAQDTLAGLRDAAILLLMSDGLLRIGEAVAVDCEHITREPDGSGRLFIPASKTDQEGKGASLFLTKGTMQAVEALQLRAGYTTGALFRRVRRGGYVQDARLSAFGVRDIIKHYARQIGVEGASGHSLRIGSAQELVQRGASLLELQGAGRWTDPKMPGHYAKEAMAGQSAVARLFG